MKGITAEPLRIDLHQKILQKFLQKKGNSHKIARRILERDRKELDEPKKKEIQQEREEGS